MSRSDEYEMILVELHNVQARSYALAFGILIAICFATFSITGELFWLIPGFLSLYFMHSGFDEMKKVKQE